MWQRRKPHSQSRPLLFPVQIPPSVAQKVAPLVHQLNQTKVPMCSTFPSLLSNISKSKNLRKQVKGPQQQKGKRSKPDEVQYNKTDKELGKSESLLFKKKGKSKQSRKSQKGLKLEDELGEDNGYVELIKAQTKALKKNEEETKQLFDYLRESDNRIRE